MTESTNEHIAKVHKFWASADTWSESVVKEPNKYIQKAAKDLIVITTAFHESQLKVQTLETDLKTVREELKARDTTIDGTTFTFHPGMKMNVVYRKTIICSLKFFGENRTHAAKALGISIRGLRNRLVEYIKQGHYSQNMYNYKS